MNRLLLVVVCIAQADVGNAARGGAVDDNADNCNSAYACPMCRRPVEDVFRVFLLISLIIIVVVGVPRLLLSIDSLLLVLATH